MSIPIENVKFGSCSLESDKFITVCETVAGAQQIAIVDMTAGNTITRQKISAEAAIMNPLSKVIALKGVYFLSKIHNLFNINFL
jgi:clathrin heavy chain